MKKNFGLDELGIPALREEMRNELYSLTIALRGEAREIASKALDYKRTYPRYGSGEGSEAVDWLHAAEDLLNAANNLFDMIDESSKKYCENLKKRGLK